MSVSRLASAAETAAALSVADALDHSIDGSYVAAGSLSRPRVARAKPITPGPGRAPVFGEQPVAFVTLRAGQDAGPEDLAEHCRPSLARYKVPRAVFIEADLPENA